jgi:hypothetical protein
VQTYVCLFVTSCRTARQNLAVVSPLLLSWPGRGTGLIRVVDILVLVVVLIVRASNVRSVPGHTRYRQQTTTNDSKLKLKLNPISVSRDQERDSGHRSGSATLAVSCVRVILGTAQGRAVRSQQNAHRPPWRRHGNTRGPEAAQSHGTLERALF